MKFARSFLMTGFTFALAGLCHGQNAVVVGQWDALTERVASTNGVTRWLPTRGSAELLYFAAEWEADATTDALKNVVGAEGHGLYVDAETSSGASVRSGVMVVKPNALHVLSALLTSEFLISLANFPAGGEDGYFSEIGAAENTRVWVNGKEGEPLTQNWCVVSFSFPADADLTGAVVCGDPSLNRSWARTFDGEVKSVVLFGGAPLSDDARKGVESALARRFGVAGIPPASTVQQAAALGTGFNSRNAWASLLLVR